MQTQLIESTVTLYNHSLFPPLTSVRSCYHVSPPGEPARHGELAPKPPPHSQPHTPHCKAHLLLKLTELQGGGIIHQYQESQYKRHLNYSGKRYHPVLAERGLSPMMSSRSLRRSGAYGCVCDSTACMCVFINRVSNVNRMCT